MYSAVAHAAEYIESFPQKSISEVSPSLLAFFALSLIAIFSQNIRRTHRTEKGGAPSYVAAFRAIALILPRRVYIEDLGEALEEIALLEQAKAPRWQIRLKLICTHFWLLLNALREVVSVIKGLARSKQ